MDGKEKSDLTKTSLYEFRHNLGLLLDTRYKLLGLQMSHIEKEYSFWFKEQMKLDCLETHESSWPALFKHEKLLKDRFFVVTKNSVQYVKSNPDKLGEDSTELFSFANYKELQQWRAGNKVKPCTAEAGVQVSLLPQFPSIAEDVAKFQERPFLHRSISLESGASVPVKVQSYKCEVADCAVLAEILQVEAVTQTSHRRLKDNASQTSFLRQRRSVDSGTQTVTSTLVESAVQTPQSPLVATGVQTTRTVNARIQTRPIVNCSKIGAGTQTENSQISSSGGTQKSIASRAPTGNKKLQKSSCTGGATGNQNLKKSSFVAGNREIQNIQNSSAVNAEIHLPKFSSNFAPANTGNVQRSSSIEGTAEIQSLQKSSSVGGITRSQRIQKNSSIGVESSQHSSSAATQNPNKQITVGVDTRTQLPPSSSHDAEISVQTLPILTLEPQSGNDEPVSTSHTSQPLASFQPVPTISTTHEISTAMEPQPSSCLIYDYGHSSSCNTNFSANESGSKAPNITSNKNVDYREVAPGDRQLVTPTPNKRRCSGAEDDKTPNKLPKFQPTFQPIHVQNESVAKHKTIDDIPLENVSELIHSRPEISLVKTEQLEQEQRPKINDEVLDMDMELHKIFVMLPDHIYPNAEPSPHRSKSSSVDPNALVTGIDSTFLEDMTKLVQKTSGPRRLIGSSPKSARKEQWIVFPIQNKGLGIYLSNHDGTPFLWKGDLWDPNFTIPEDGVNLPFVLPPCSLVYGEFLEIRQKVSAKVFVEFNIIDVGSFLGKMLDSENFYERYSLCRNYFDRYSKELGPLTGKMFVTMKPTKPLQHVAKSLSLIKRNATEKTYYTNRTNTSLDVSGVGLMQVYTSSESSRKNEFQFAMRRRYILNIEYSSNSFLDTTVKELSKVFVDMDAQPHRT